MGQLDYLSGRELRELKALRRDVILKAAQIRAEAALNRVRVDCVEDVTEHALGRMADINISRQMHVARTNNDPLYAQAAVGIELRAAAIMGRIVSGCDDGLLF